MSVSSASREQTPTRSTARAPGAAQSAASGATPRGPRRRGSVLRWVGATTLLVGASLALIVLNGSAPGAREPLDPESASPEGAKALVQVLGDHGVPVEIAEGREAALRLLGADGESILVMTAPPIPSDAATEAMTELIREAQQTVFLTADEKVLQDFELGEAASFDADELVDEPGNATCPATPYSRVGEIRAQVLFEPGAGVHGCFRSEDGRAALIVAPSRGGGGVSMLDATELFDNGHLTENGNAALAFAILGSADHVIWYVATPEDIASDRTGTLAALTPTWVTPAMLLLLLTAVVAAVWRGRRFGPLVEEHLPVTVRASETMLGRARLAARGGDAAHAAAALRAGAVRRLAHRVGLPGTASPEQITRALPDLPSLAPLLNGPLPESDAELMRFSRQLRAILDRVDPLPAARQPIATPPMLHPPNATDERPTP